MIIWSRRRTLVAGMALILIVNMFALAGVAYNRSGEPDSRLRLSQRELALPYSWQGSSENSGIALRLQWRVPVVEESPDAIARWSQMDYLSNYGFPAWMDKTKLESLGFDISEMKALTDGRRQNNLLSKEVYLVLELDGPAYQQMLARVRQYAADAEASYAATNAGSKDILARRLKDVRDKVIREERENSRLFVVDAGLDIGLLRSKYPDRAHYAIIHGQVRPQIIGLNKDKRLSAHISSSGVSQINVPFAFRQMFESLLQSNQTGARKQSAQYEANVAFGKRLEPWLTAVSR